jgi:hypothetical protein
MSEGDWRQLVAIGGLIAVLLFSAFAGYENLSARQAARDGIAQAEQQQAKCDPQQDDYYDCADLIAQQGMHTATDRLVRQGFWDLTLGWSNLFLLIGTLVASIIATLIAADAVKISRKEMENSLQPRLGLRFKEWNWDADKGPDPAHDPFLIPPNPAETTYYFHNFGEGAALLDALHIRHYWRDEGDFPEPEPLYSIFNFRDFPEGNWVKKGEDSQDFQAEPFTDVANDPRPKTNSATWYIAGVVFYEGLPGVRYMTRFCYYFDKKDRTFYLGPGGQNRFLYNFTRPVDAKLRKLVDFDRLLRAQY